MEEHGSDVSAEANRIYSMQGPTAMVAYLDSVLAHEPDHVEALVIRATAFLELRRFEDAKADAARATAIDPTALRCYQLAIRLAVKSGDLDRALDIADRAFDTSDGEYELYRAIGYLQFATSDPDDSLRTWLNDGRRISERWYAKSPQSADARQYVARERAEGNAADVESAFRMAKELVAEDPSDPNRHELLVDVAAKAGRLQEAKESLETRYRMGGTDSHFEDQIRKWICAEVRGVRLHRLLSTGSAATYLPVIVTTVLFTLLVFLNNAALRGGPTMFRAALLLECLVVAWWTLLPSWRLSQHPVFGPVVRRPERVANAINAVGLVVACASFLVSAFGPSEQLRLIMIGLLVTTWVGLQSVWLNTAVMEFSPKRILASTLVMYLIGVFVAIALGLEYLERRSANASSGPAHWAAVASASRTANALDAVRTGIRASGGRGLRDDSG